MQAKPFTDTLGEIESGELLRDLTKAIREVTNAALETRKPGGVTLSLTLSPTGKGSIKIDSKINSKVPEHDRPSTTFFATPDGTLLRDDPAQPRLPLRAVDDDRSAIRTIDDDDKPLRVVD